MILSTQDAQETYLQQGIWGRTTLDDLLARASRKSPDNIALNGYDEQGQAYHYSFQQLDQKVNALADFFFEAGLKADDVVAIQMGPSIDYVITTLALSRAGLISAHIPLTWSASNMIQALGSLSPKALISASGDIHSDAIRKIYPVAADLFSVRLVGGFGQDMPDGVVNLAHMIEGFKTKSYKAKREDNAALHVASVHFTAHPSGDYICIPHSHNQWVANGLMTLIEGRFNKKTKLFSNYQFSSVTAFSSALVPWLLSGSTLTLSHFQTLEHYVHDIIAQEITHALLPASLVEPFLSCFPEERSSLSTLLCVGHHEVPYPIHEAPYHFVSITALNNCLTIPKRFEHHQPCFLQQGAYHYPQNSHQAPKFLEISLKETSFSGFDQELLSSASLGGELLVKGSCVPDAPWPKGSRSLALSYHQDGFLRTRLAYRHHQNGTLSYLGSLDNLVQSGGLHLSLSLLDETLQNFEGIQDAACYTLPDAIMGQRIACALKIDQKTHLDLQTLHAYLISQNIDAALLPTQLLKVDEIPRGVSGSVLVDQLTLHYPDFIAA